MKHSRLVGFIVAIVIGVAIGLVYGWVLNPSGAANTSLDSLRSDYKADYVLMVAENYAANGDVAAALNLLGLINPDSPLAAVQEGLVNAQQIGYSTNELQFMANLEKAITGPQGGGSSQ